MCIPSINIDGSIATGESNACFIIGKVTDDFTDLIKNLCLLKCARCGLINNLNNIQKKVIGEL